MRYRLRSACHYDLPVEVYQTACQDDLSGKLTPDSTLKLVFHDHGRRTFCRVCRVNPNQTTRTTGEAQGINFQVSERQGFVSLDFFLQLRFPVHRRVLPAKAHSDWWDANGKSFNQAGLPTELKDKVVQACMHRYREDRPGEWSALLGVSVQVRSITLRRCFQDMPIVVQSHADSKDNTTRLSKYY